jgi:CDP-glycerol glycerophosphotransferase
MRTLRDRFAAVEQARAFLVEQGPAGSPRWYDECVVGEDLLYHLDVLPEGDDAYREAFLDLATVYLGRAGEGIEDALPPIQRLKWHLVRGRRLPELLEVVRFERDELRRNRKVWIGGRAYGAYPYLGDPSIPRRVYRLDTTRRRARHAIGLLRAQSRGPRP